MRFLSRSERVPDPCVSIVLDGDCQGLFHPGNRVSGTIVLQSNVQRRLALAEVFFSGHALTHLTRRESSGDKSSTIHYKHDAELFCFDQRLSEDHTIFEDQQLSWRFQFSFPQTTKPSGPSPYIRATASSDTYSNDEHSLPPSFTHQKAGTRYAKVEYSIDAHFHFEDCKDPYITHLALLDLVPHDRCPRPPPISEHTMPTQRYASSRLVGEDKSFKHSIRDRFSSNTPSVNLTMKASAPSFHVSGIAFPIYTCVEIDLSRSPAIAIPTMSIAVKSLQLCQITYYRALKYRGGSVRREVEQVDTDFVTLNTLPEQIRVQQQQRNGSGDDILIVFPATFEARIPGDVCPSFRTYNINHNFTLLFEVEAEVCGRKFEHKVVVENLIVFPA